MRKDGTIRKIMAKWLLDLLPIPGLTQAHARTLALAKLEVDGVLNDVRPADPRDDRAQARADPVEPNPWDQSVRTSGEQGLQDDHAWLPGLAP